MGRVTEVISFINKKDAPPPLETKHFYTHMGREKLMELRRKYKKAVKA